MLYTPITEWIAQLLYIPPAASFATVDAIVIMEAWASEDGEPNEAGLRRAMRAADLYRGGLIKPIVVTGLAPSSSRPGSALKSMSRILVLGGVPSEVVILEDASHNTHESAVNVAALARSRGWRHIALVTDAMHMRRASLSFQKAGLTVAGAPTLLWDLGGAQPALRLQRIGSLAHEFGGTLYYAWKGWI